MGKLVVLKITDGSFEQGFTVTLQIGEENARHAIETVGRLPAAPELPQYYDRWQSSYYQLGQPVRLTATKVQKPDPARLEECRKAAQELQTQLNTWLLSEPYRPIREKWLERLTPDQEIRVILQTEDPQIRRLPWHLLDFLERYPKAEIALSALKWEVYEQPQQANSNVKILAILGDSTGIDTNADRALLEKLPQAAPTFLPEPSRKEITDRLWQQPWDILFFAGHSASQGSTGRIFLNQTDSLTISDLKNGLRKAIQQGLKFAIFNSCDGLGLVPELADLQIPQMVVMREPVPDLVAQEFLKYFLDGFSQGKPFYLAVREAREHLEGLEDQFPCATWLPVICQHPAVIPPTWQELIQPDSSLQRPSVKQGLAIALLTSLTVTAFISGIRFMGLLQPLELNAFDQTMQLRPAEPPDPRLLIVTIDDEDLRQQRRTERLNAVSITDANLSKLLSQLTAHQPRAIGLDIYRDEATAPTHPELIAQFRDNQALVSICKVGFDKANPYGIAPPPEIPHDSYRVGFSDFISDDSDEIVRRHLLGMRSEGQTESQCHASFAFSTELALRYLRDHTDPNQTGFDANWNLNIQVNRAPKDLITKVPHSYLKPAQPGRQASWQPDQVALPRLRSHASGYQGMDHDGGQILLNYRASKELGDIAAQKPLRWFLSQQTPPSAQELADLINGKVVLIGVTAREKEDSFKTPYGAEQDERTPGVFIHAHMISQILAAVLDDRPLLWVFNPWADVLWIGGWSLVGGMLVGGLYLRTTSRQRLLPQITLAVGLAVGLLYGTCAGIFIWVGGWLPLVPPVLALIVTSGGVVILLDRQHTRFIKNAELH
ncbi:MAG: CHASE2 domain-containing protein [Leptolyngbyaceae cyanobacterium RU_5_1]|nr:CHASE2 domain-containing protein [Leptolyngbyaceae cyanobacterium RU_5_1]